MSTKAKSSIPPEIEALYDKVIATNPLTERKGATMPYTSVNGNMFTFIDKNGELSIRLPEHEREQFIAKYNSRLSVQHGAVMKEYVVVPAALLQNTDQLKAYIDKSFDYAQTLKPKPTKKKKP